MKQNLGGMVFLMGAAMVFFYAADAHAFQHTMTCNDTGSEHRCAEGQTPRPLRWSARCVRYEISADAIESAAGGSTQPANLNAVHRAVAQSFDAWTEVTCSDMTLIDGGFTAASSADDARANRVFWRSEGWTDMASSNAFALTSVTYNPRNGLIANANIYINTDLYAYSASDSVDSGYVDLRNTLTHEVGHFIGLDHSDLRNATMFPTAPVGQTSKRKLHPDDINGLCATYPLRKDKPPQCLRASEFPREADLGLNQPACNAAGESGEPPTGALLVLLGLLLLVMRNGRRVSPNQI